MQTRLNSLIEQILNVGSGFIIALLVWIFIITPLFGITVTMVDNLTITAIFTVVSIIRGFLWRRLFNHFTVKKMEEKNART